MAGVGLTVEGRRVLEDIDWTVGPRERWVVLGANGSGKTSLIRIAGLWLHPSTGSVRVCGGELGRSDVRRLRRRIGFASAALADMLRPRLTAAEVVMTAREAALEPWWHTYDDRDRRRAVAALDRVGAGALAERPFGVLSSGERQRVLLARALSTDPDLVLLDEPTAALDLAGREDLVEVLGALAEDPAVPPLVLVTHHVEEIPAAFTHALLLAGGRRLAAGPIEQVLTAEALAACFGVAVSLERRDGRWWAWKRR
ncbi:MAG: ATP-binding cassette domain-containing protein [Actinomyces sp.]|nr:MAG: ATP-binding cassette domain-containing protein [Actinomyces sp.]